MKLWNRVTADMEEIPDSVAAFLDEIEEVCKKHGFGIGHEDGHGAFKITTYDGGWFPGDAKLDLK